MCGSSLSISPSVCSKNTIIPLCTTTNVTSKCWCEDKALSTGVCNSVFNVDSTLQPCKDSTFATSDCKCGTTNLPANLGACVSNIIVPQCLNNNVISPINC